jgi:hypothetical protein
MPQSERHLSSPRPNRLRAVCSGGAGGGGGCDWIDETRVLRRRVDRLRFSLAMVCLGGVGTAVWLWWRGIEEKKWCV